MDFDLGQPFKPFQQLMGVLPDRSKNIVPSAYHPLMTSSESPIIDFYPRDFELDMNGKKMEWEAVVKIPFIDENRLLAAMSTKELLLSPNEQARNGFGVSLKFTYSPSIEFIYPSSLPGIFPDIQKCQCIENIFDLPTMDGLEPFIGLVDGVKLGESALAGFPSLKTLPHAGQLGFHGINVFQQDSRNESMIITILDTEMRSNVELAKAKLGQRVYIGYPFLQEALVIRASDELFDYVLPEGERHIDSIPHSPTEIDKWRNKADRIEDYYSKRLGMMIGPVELMLHVQMLKGLKKSDQGATFKEFAEIPGQETDYALQLVVNEVVSEDERFIEKEAVPIEEEFPEGSRAFFLGEFNYGRPVHVIGHEHGKVNGLIASVKGKEPDFGKQHTRNAEELSPYTPSFAISRTLHLNPLVLAKITSSFSVTVNGQRVNLGLNLKFEARKQKVLGYSRRGNSGWEFSPKAIELIQDYMTRFPEFFAGIQNNPQGDKYEPTDFFSPDIALQKIKEIGEWLKSIEAKNFERVPLDAEQLDSDVVKLIELDASRLVQSQQQVEPQKIKGVPRVALLKPSDAEKRLGNQNFTLGDRVVYIQDSGKVPIATRGTVVGLTRTPRTVLLDVVFDFSFMSGTTLGDRCSPFRGSTVPVSAVLNLTDRQLIVNTRAATDQQTQKQTLNPMARGYGPPLGPGGQGQLRDAHDPPPLRGTWRGVVTGQQNTNRGIVTRGQRDSRGSSNGVSNSWSTSAISVHLPIRPQLIHGPQQNNYSSFRGGRGRGAPVNGHRGNRGGQVAGRNGFADMGSRNYTFVPPPASLTLGNGQGGRRNGGSRGAGRDSGHGGSGSSD